MSLVCAVERTSRASRTVSSDCVSLDRVARHALHRRAVALSPGCRMRPGESESDSGYLAGRKATWIWAAIPGALKLKTSLVL